MARSYAQGKHTDRKVTFQIRAEEGSEVYVAGTFNEWNATSDKLAEKNGLYSTTLLIPRGRHEYKFIVNGVWCVDPGCPVWVPNEVGSLNSVITVE